LHDSKSGLTFSFHHLIFMHDLQITYCHGSENFFLNVDGLTSQFNFKEVDYQQFTIDAVSQLSGIKIDGILYLLPSKKADARMRIFNRDGSEAEMCGNGFRCLGKKLWQITGKSTYQIETLSGILKGQKLPDMFPQVDTYRALFPKVNFNYKEKVIDNQIIKELSPDLKFSSVNIGNPHLITQVNDFDVEKLIEIGKKINHQCRLFPQGNNLSFYKVLSDNRLSVLTYERGVGPTASCGTAMAAVSVLAAHHKQVKAGQQIEVYSPGGMLVCQPEKKETYQVMLSGNATFEQQFQLTYDSHNRKISAIRNVEYFQDEIQAYNTFKSHIKHTLIL